MPVTAVLRRPVKRLVQKPVESPVSIIPKKFGLKGLQFFTFQGIGGFRTIRIDPHKQPRLLNRFLRLKDLQQRFNNILGIKKLRQQLKSLNDVERRRVAFSEIKKMQTTRPLSKEEWREYKYLIGFFSNQSLESQHARRKQ